MRRDGPGASMAMAAVVASIAALAPAACIRAPACEPAWDGVSCAAACPREAAVDATGRCACADGDVLALGACVPPPVAAAFCGAAASASPAGGGCAFLSCSSRGGGEVLDAITGACVPRASLPHGGSIACEAPTMPIVEEGHAACVPPDATCPRGTTYRADADADADADANANRATRAGVCVRPPACPPGTLNEGTTCRAVVTAGGRSGRRVDVGAWAALAIGIDGGRGSSWLCQPLAQHPGLFADDRADVRAAGAGADGSVGVSVSAGARTAAPAVVISVSATFPDEDLSRLHVEVDARSARSGGAPLAPPAVGAISNAVGTLFELLRGLGGEASAAAVGLEVTCTLAPSR
jgi:hypothetical protein